MSVLKTFVAALLLLKGLHRKMPGIESYVCSEAEIELLDDVYAQEDGEVYFYPGGTRIKVSVESKALNVLSASTAESVSV